MKQLHALAATTLLLLASVSGPVSARSFGDIYLECGLGALLFPEHNTLAAITNVTWDSGTTAISSDATTPDSCKGKKAAAAAFIHYAYTGLEGDLARGAGTYLDTLVGILGCTPTQAGGVRAALREDFAVLLQTGGYEALPRVEQSSNLHTVVMQRIERDFGTACAV